MVHHVATYGPCESRRNHLSWNLHVSVQGESFSQGSQTVIEEIQMSSTNAIFQSPKNTFHI